MWRRTGSEEGFMPLRHQKGSNMNLMSILLSKVIVSASSAAVALAFDAGGNQRQEDIWVAEPTVRRPNVLLAAHLTQKRQRIACPCMGTTILTSSSMPVSQLNSAKHEVIYIVL